MHNQRVVGKRRMYYNLCHGTYVREVTDYYISGRSHSKKNDCHCRCDGSESSEFDPCDAVHLEEPNEEARLAGIQVQLRHAGEATVKSGEHIVFDHTLRKTGHIIGYKKEKGEFLLKQPGLYLINWDIAIEDDSEEHFPRFAILENDEILCDATLPTTKGQLSNSCYVVVEDNPVVLSLTNKTEGGVQLSSGSPVANLNIVQIKEQCIEE